MKNVLITLCDTKAGTYSNPTSHPSIEQARREFADAVNSGDKTNSVALHPEDFCLMHVGSFDIRTGELVSLEKPMNVVNGVDVLLRNVGSGDDAANAA